MAATIVGAFAGGATEALGAAIVNVSCMLAWRTVTPGEGFFSVMLATLTLNRGFVFLA